MKIDIPIRGLFMTLIIAMFIPLQAALADELELKQHGIKLDFPNSWKASKHASNAQLKRQPTQSQRNKGAVLEAENPRMMISTEKRLDHDGAVRRLLDIGGVHGATWEYLEIGGWPALQQKYLRNRPQASGGDILGSETILVVQTVVAVDNTLVRMETWLTPDASDSEVEEIKGIGRSLSTQKRSNAAQVAKKISGLKKAQAPRGKKPVPPPATSAPVTTVISTGSPSLDQIPAEGVDNIAAGYSIPVSNQGGRDSELEIAVSPNGQDIVIGSNLWWYFSSDGGQTWNLSSQGGTSFTGNDPSVAWGQSGGAQGTFYGANIASPSTGMITSIDGGSTWQPAPAVYTCGQGGDAACAAAFPDQEHIASDRLNVTAGGDQVYSAWRHLDGNWGIVCTQDSGANWSNNAFFRTGDLPKPGVGPGGFVYVIYLSGGNIMLDKFAPCEVQTNPMTPVAGFPVVVKANAAPVACPTPGLDRCNRRNTLSGITVAVDDTDSNHVYVSYAVNSNPGSGGPFFEGSPVCNDQNLCNENIVVQDSLDGGVSWRGAGDPADVCVLGICAVSGLLGCSNNTDCYDPDRIINVSSGVTARRFMPWLCTIDGTAHVSWYDRRAAFPGGGVESNNSLTDFYAGSASLDAIGNLQSNGEFQVNDLDTEDAQCESGFITGSTGSWPAAVDRARDSEDCSVQPQLGGSCNDRICQAGFCADGSGTACVVNNDCNTTRCDFSDCGGNGNNNGGACLCGAAFTCDRNRGSPKYGDYNGNACAAGRLYMTWASAEAPLAAPAATDIDSVFSSEVVCCVPQIQVPGNIDFGEACGLDQQKETLNVCNTGKENLEIVSITGDTQFAVTDPLTGYPVTISPDFCFPFEVTYDPDGTGNDLGVLIINNNDPVNPALEVGVTGNIGEADISTFIADNGSFGEICSGDLHDLNLTIQSNGSCPLEIDSVSLSGTDAADFELPNGSLAGTIIEAGNSLLVPVRFAPDNFTDPNPRTADVDVASRTQGGNALALDTTPIEGTVPPPDINVTIANDGDFGNVCKGDHADLDLMIFNNGMCDLLVESIVLNPPGGSFILPSDTDIPMVISPDAEFTYPIRYAPESCDDTPETAQVLVNSDDPDEPQEVVDISGTSPCPNLIIDPAALSGLYAFATTVVDTGATLGCYTDRDVTLRNTGLCPLTISNISAADADFTVIAPTEFPAPGIVLPTGEETLDVTIRFTPQADVDPQVPSEVLGLLTINSDDPDFPHTADLCGESALQSGVRILVSDVSSGVPIAVDEVDSMAIQSKGKNRPGPINLQFTDQPLSSTVVCGNTIAYHVNQETLPSTHTTGSNPKSSYQAKAKEGNLQAAESFTLEQCEFRDFQLQLQDSDSPVCALAQKGEACTTAGDCCSNKCKGPDGGKTCK